MLQPCGCLALVCISNTFYFTRNCNCDAMRCYDASNQRKTGMSVGVQRIRVNISQVTGQQAARMSLNQWQWAHADLTCIHWLPANGQAVQCIERGRSTVNTHCYRHAHLSSYEYLAGCSTPLHHLSHFKDDITDEAMEERPVTPVPSYTLRLHAVSYM